MYDIPKIEIKFLSRTCCKITISREQRLNAQLLFIEPNSDKQTEIESRGIINYLLLLIVGNVKFTVNSTLLPNVCTCVNL